jgi:hypothetical protein
MFVNGSGKRRIRAIATGVASLAVAAALGGLLYYGFHTLPVSSVHPLSSAPAEIAAPAIYAESMPAVGTGQRLALPGVRYCHYQEERLRIIQRQARSPEDVRAFNLLAVDYNARCSDFFYQDVDVNRVIAEIAERRQQLDAEARRMMATWPGHEHDADGGRVNPR